MVTINPIDRFKDAVNQVPSPTKSSGLLQERKKKLEQRKQRLKQMEASLNVQARKQRTRRLIEMGGLIAKAQLDEWNSNTLFGALLFVKETEGDLKQLEFWTTKGGAAFAIATLPKNPAD